MWSIKKLPWQFEGRLKLLRSFPDHKKIGTRRGGRETLWRLLVRNRKADKVPAAG
jgi:hypothetical protein